MHSRRRNRLFTVLLVLVSLLFMQFAVASYSCPAISKALEIQAMAQSNIPCAVSMAITMDPDQPGLCQAHCQADNQSADTYQMPGLAAQTDLTMGFVPPRVIPVAQGTPLQAPLLLRATAPPLAVRNCCFRI